jgi:hypothetical protein
MNQVSLVTIELTTDEVFKFPVAHNGHPLVVARHLYSFEPLFVRASRFDDIGDVEEARQRLEGQWYRYTDYADGNDNVSDTQYSQALELYHVTMDLLNAMDNE